MTDASGGPETTGGGDVPGILAPAPLLFAVPLVVGILVDQAYSLNLPLSPAWRWAVGGSFVAAGLLLTALALATLRRRGTSENPYRPTTRIATDGPYRFSRNPIYLAYALMYAGAALGVDSGWALIVSPATLLAVHYGVIIREERYLERKFPAEYSAYRARVRRWL